MTAREIGFIEAIYRFTGTAVPAIGWRACGRINDVGQCEYGRRENAIGGIEKGMVRKLRVLEYCGNCSQLYRLFKSD